MKRSLATIAALLVISAAGFAQISLNIGPNLHAGKTGLGLDGITGSPNLLLKYFFNNQLAGQIVAGFDLDSPGGDAPAGQKKVTGTTLRGGLAVLYHLTQDQVSPYLGFEGIFQSEMPGGFYVNEPDRKNSIIVAAVLGGEYFMNEKFSLGIKHSLGAEIRLKRDRPQEETDLRFSTSTLVTGRFYFN
jgi:hypothetical protein